MYNIAIVHVQTSGKQLNYDTPVSDFNNWVRAITINWAVCDIYANIYDEDAIDSSFNKILPIGYKVDNESLMYSEIKLNELIDKGNYVRKVLNKFLNSIENVDYVIGHNIDFHLNIIRSELLRNGFQDIKNLDKICLMNIGVNFCKIPNNKFGFKYPTLKELYHNIFKEEIESNNAHVSLNSLIEIYKYFLKNSLINITGFKPITNIKYLKIPFKIKTDSLAEIRKNNDKFDFFINNTRVLEQLDSIEYFDEMKLYLGETEMLNYKGKKINKKIVFDYRGIIILEVFNSGDITIEKHGIYFDTGRYFGIEQYCDGIYLQNLTDYKSYMSYYDSSKCVTLGYLDGVFQFLIPKSTRKILFEGCNIFVNKYSETVLNVTENNIFLYDYDCNFLYSFKIEYDFIDIIPKSDFFLIKKNGKVGIADLETKEIVIIPKYGNFISYEKGLFHFFENGHYILINDREQIIYKSDLEFCFIKEKELVVVLPNNSSEKLIYDLKGKLISKGIFDEIIELDNQNYSVYKIIAKNGKVDIIVLNYKTDINLIYDDASFRDCTIYYENNDLLGILNIETNLSLEDISVESYSIHNNAFHYYYIEDKFGVGSLIDSKGSIILNDVLFHQVFKSNDLIFVKMEISNNTVLYNLNDNSILINDVQKVMQIKKSDDFILAVTKKSKVNYLNISKKIESDYIYDDLCDLIDFEKEDRRFWLNHYTFIKDRLIVSKNGKFGFLDENLNEVIECKYSSAKPFEKYENAIVLALTKLEEEFYIDVLGNKRPFF